MAEAENNSTRQWLQRTLTTIVLVIAGFGVGLAIDNRGELDKRAYMMDSVKANMARLDANTEVLYTLKHGQESIVARLAAVESRLDTKMRPELGNVQAEMDQLRQDVQAIRRDMSNILKQLNR